MSAGPNLLVMTVIVLLTIVGCQSILSSRKNMVWGFIVPTFFLAVFGYNLFKSLYVYNPYPNMGEGMMMLFSIIGFGISVVTLIVFRLVLRYRSKPKY